MKFFKKFELNKKKQNNTLGKGHHGDARPEDADRPEDAGLPTDTTAEQGTDNAADQAYGG